MELIVRLAGDVKESNFCEFKEEILAVIGGINTDLQTDEDFAIAEEAAKTCKMAEEAISEAKKAALDQTKSIRELYDAMDEVSNRLRETRLDLSKKVKTRKDEITARIVRDAATAIKDTIEGAAAHVVAKATFAYDQKRLQDSVKGKRSIATMEAAVSKEIGDILADFGRYASLVSSNAEIVKPYAAEYPSLFSDERTILAMPSLGLNEVIDSRIAQRKAEDEARRLKDKAEDEARRLKEEVMAKDSPPVESVTTSLPVVDPVEEKPQQDGAFIIKVVLDCDKERAIRIAQTLKNTMDAYGDSVKSINLARI